MSDPKPMTGPEHVREALRLNKEAAMVAVSNSSYAQVIALRAQVHAILAQTAAMVDKRQLNDGSVTRSRQGEQAWHQAFAVEIDRL